MEGVTFCETNVNPSESEYATTWHIAVSHIHRHPLSQGRLPVALPPLPCHVYEGKSVWATKKLLHGTPLGKAVSELSGFLIFPNYGYLKQAHPRPSWTCRRSHINNKIKVDYHSFSVRRQHRVPKSKPDWWGIFDFGAILLFLTYKAAAWASFMLSRHALWK